MRVTFPAWAARVLGSPGKAGFRTERALVAKAGMLETRMKSLDDGGLRAEIETLRTGQVSSADPWMAEYLAVVREVAVRTLSLRPHDEQLVACTAVIAGKLVEMDTGEGKTLVGALAAAGHSISGRRVHVLSVNDYLAERDAAWMEPLFGFFGVTVGWVGQQKLKSERRQAYRADVVYSPVSEVGFDLLRDRFCVEDADRVDPVFDVAIVDEADAVMIDEAMVPLILAGESDDFVEGIELATTLVGDLDDGLHFQVDTERANVTLTDAGIDMAETSAGGVNLFAAENIGLLTQVNLALHARVLVQRDVDYIVDEGRVKLVSASRGRVAHRQRWPDGLHAAIEAKEGIPISRPGVVLDTVAVQDLLLRYDLLSGMSGTVVAVAEDMDEFYQKVVGRIERHAPNLQVDEGERIFLTASEKFEAVVAYVRARHLEGQPILVGTQNVAESEELAASLRELNISPRVLNAKNDADEAAIVARAGEHGAVTISTQMSGRGTDIRLGGVNGHDFQRVSEARGLGVLATSRFPSRRLDAQLRGRSGRQSDPGSSIVFASLEDELVQANAPAFLVAEIARKGTRLTHARRLTIVNSCQAIAEGRRLDRHRATWSYSRAIASQRDIVLHHRDEVMNTDLALTRVSAVLGSKVSSLVRTAGQESVLRAIRAIALFHLDDEWQTHLGVLNQVRDGIHLRALAGQEPSEEFHKIALQESEGFVERTYERTSNLVSSLSVADLARGPEGLGLRRPSSTWTYMVTDDPIGSAGDRFARALGGMWRRTINLE